MRCVVSLVGVLGATQLGCSTSAIAPPSSGTAPHINGEGPDAENLEVDLGGLASATVELLSTTGNEPHRMGLLVGVVQQQLARAATYFRSGHDEMGLATIRAAFYLIRAGQVRTDMLVGHGGSLAYAANVLARLGDEGQAEALYSLLVDRLPDSAERQDAIEHLEALRRWQQDTRKLGSMQARSASQRAAIHQALLDPSRETLQRAHEESRDWVRQALTFGGEQRPPRNHFEQDETIAAFRAARSAALTFSALYLRQGDAIGALQAVGEQDVSRLTSPHIRKTLELASEGEPGAWLQLYRLFDTDPSDRDSGLGLDPDVASAAAWGAAMELYRLQPDSLRASAPLATQLLTHGMGEVVPLLLGPVLIESDSPAELSGGLRAILSGIAQFEGLGDMAAARRLYDNAEPLLARAAETQFQGRLNPPPGVVHYQMGAQLARAGELGEARGLLTAAVAAEPFTNALRMLSTIDRQRGNLEGALAALDKIVTAPQGVEELISKAETFRQRFEILRELGRVEQATESLEIALTESLKARKQARNRQTLAYAERVVGRVLEHYGRLDEAGKAGKRAFEASRNDIQQMTQTVLDTSRRALTVGDIRSARDSVRRAMAAELADEDTIYAALWLKLLEGRLGVASDGTVERALAGIETSTGWTAALTAWGRGKWSDAQLLSRASNRTEKVEAMFYLAMSAPRSEDSLSQLKKVAGSEAIQLVEVMIARDLLAHTKKRQPPSLPSRIRLPQ